MLASLKSKLILALIIFAITVFSCFSFFKSHQKTIQETEQSGSEHITIYFSDKNSMFLVPIAYPVTEKDINPEKAIQLLISSEPPDRNLLKVFPSNVKLLQMNIKDGIAYMNFSQEFKEIFENGLTDGTMLINSLKYTLSFFNLKGIKISINESSIKSLGDMDFSEIIPVDKWKNIYISGKETSKEENMTTLYFIDLYSNYLVPVTIYLGKSTYPENIIKSLKSGLDEKWVRPAIPYGTKIISFKSEGDSAYIDLNSDFLDFNKELKPELVINSLTLSLMENTNINRLYLSVEGKPLTKYSSLNVPYCISRPKIFNIADRNVNNSVKEVTSWSLIQDF